jgi:hypothetical protein
MPKYFMSDNHNGISCVHGFMPFCRLIRTLGGTSIHICEEKKRDRLRLAVPYT